MLGLPIASIKEPNLPVYFALRETLALEKLALKDQASLTLRNWTGHLLLVWHREPARFRKPIQIICWHNLAAVNFWQIGKKLSTEATLNREELVHGMLYAFYGNEMLLDAVRAVMQGSSYADLVKDQSDLEGLGIKYKDLLDAAGIDFKLVERVGELKFVLGDLLAQTDVEKMEKSHIGPTRIRWRKEVKNARQTSFCNKSNP